MGYTHYWDRQVSIPPKTYGKIAHDFRQLLPTLEEWGIQLAGGLGEGEPQIDETDVCFNGNMHCGHQKDTEVTIPWPSDGARGVAIAGEDVKAGQWVAGTLLEKRTCNGDCSYETFHFPRVYKPGAWQELREGLYFNCCKTAFRPYDLAVTAFLVVAKHHLGKRLLVHSDGEVPQWQDAMLLCELELGYGLGFKLDT